MVLLIFFLGVVGMASVLWKSNYSRRVEWQQGVSVGIELSVHNVLD